MVMHDIAIPTVRNARWLARAEWLRRQLPDEHVKQSIEFVRQRYFRCLFSCPMWGDLFEETNDGNADD